MENEFGISLPVGSLTVFDTSVAPTSSQLCPKNDVMSNKERKTTVRHSRNLCV
jgi:hypothetical protein